MPVLSCWMQPSEQTVVGCGTGLVGGEAAVHSPRALDKVLPLSSLVVGPSFFGGKKGTGGSRRGPGARLLAIFITRRTDVPARIGI